MKNITLILCICLLALNLKSQTTNLKTKLMEEVEKSNVGLTEKQSEDYQKLLDTINSTGILREQIIVGDEVSDFTLTDVNGKPINLFQILEKKHVILIFYQGAWNPYCNIELGYYQQKQKELDSLDATVVAVSMQKPEFAKAMVEKLSIKFPVLYDEKGKVSTEYKLLYDLSKTITNFYKNVDFKKYYGEDNNKMSLTATYLVNKDKMIRYQKVNVDNRLRGDSDLIFTILRKFKSLKKK